MHSPFEKIYGNKTSTETEVNSAKPLPERATGKITKLSDKGWGFITSRDIPFTRIFFHWQALNVDTVNFANLQRNMTVEFTPIKREGKGLSAVKIKVVESSR